jgi:hypothetical protein
MKTEFYKKLATPPKDALKTIQAGRLKGYSDIKPQWRIEIMTDVFGLCGFGWKYTVVRTWTETGAGGQVFAFADVNLYVKVNEEWSEPIPGTGGNMLIVQEKSQLYHNDEAYKMAITDALSVAMKFIGVAADIYRGHSDTSKYTLADIPSEPKKEYKEDNRPWLTEVVLNKAIERIKAGEDDVIDKTIEAFKMKKEYKEKLLTLKK